MNSEQVVVSYSRRDADLRDWVHHLLVTLGVSVWDDRSIGLGDWRRQISQKIMTCQLVLFLATPDSTASGECAKELALARDYMKEILPLKFDDEPFHPTCAYELAGVQRIEYFSGQEIDKHQVLLRLLKDTGVHCTEQVDLSRIPSVPRTAKQPETEGPAAPAVEVAAILPQEVQENAFVLGEVLTVLGGSLEEARGDFFTLRPTRTEERDTAALLLEGRYAEAAVATNQRLRQSLHFESLRQAIFANLAEAAEQQSTDAAARGVMCLWALGYSHDLWRDQPFSPTARESVLDQSWEVLHYLIAHLEPLPSHEELTGGLTLADFVEAERECARFLSELGGVHVDTDQGPRSIAYGYLFARHYGARLDLERRGLALVSSRDKLFFSPLFGQVSLFRRSRFRQIVQSPPTWITRHNNLFVDAARIVGDSALKVLEETLHFRKLERDWLLCWQAVEELERFRLDPPTQGQARQIEQLLRRLSGEVHQATLTHGQASTVLKLYEQLKRFVPDYPTEDDRAFRAAISSKLAHQALIEDDANGFLARLAEAEEYGYQPSRAERMFCFRIWRQRAVGNKDALERLEQTLAEFKEHFPTENLSEMEKDVDRVKSLLVECLDLATAEEQYAREPSWDNRRRLFEAVPRRAEELMSQQGAGEVLALFQRLTERFPACQDLGGLLSKLVQTWVQSQKYPPLQLTNLVSRLAKLNQPATKPSPSPTETPPVGHLSPLERYEAARQGYQAEPGYQTRVDLVEAIWSRGMDLMASEGAQRAAAFLHECRGEFPNIVEVKDFLSGPQNDLWVRRFGEEGVRRFVCAWLAEEVGPAPAVKVEEPTTTLPTEELLRRTASYESQQVLQLLEQYTKHQKGKREA